MMIEYISAMFVSTVNIINASLGWLCFTSYRQRGHLETAPPFTAPCEGREARFLHRSHRKSNPGPSRGSPLHYRCASPASTHYVILYEEKLKH